MGFKCGIVGLPNVGKSTIFNALTSAGAASANYPFCTIDPNIGRVDVPDTRLALINKYIKTNKIVPASMEFVDIAGLVRGASKGEGLGNKFLGHIRETDAIAHVVRCFDSTEITHVDGHVDPLRDISTIETELIYADVGTVENALSRYSKLSKSGEKKIFAILEMLNPLLSHLQELKPARNFPLSSYVKDDEDIQRAYRDMHLMSGKPVLYVGNVSEDMANGKDHNQYTKVVSDYAHQERSKVVMICGKLEEELSELDQQSRMQMITDLDMEEPGLNRLIRAGYEILGLQTYFTAGEKEIRAWTIKKGDKAPQAAGRIHSDFERGFICAEVYTIEDLVNSGSKLGLKEKGLLRQEGRDYVVRDGDIMEFKFNV